LAVCFGCHGADGKAINPEWPNLACQNEDYMNNQIKAFRENLRPGPNMAPILAIIKDEDFKAATKYYANLEHCKK
jgi:cytochrome c553